MVLREQDQAEEEEDEEDEDDEDDEVEVTPEEKKREEKQKQKAKQCTVLVELLQKNRRQKDKVNFLYVAFHIYKVRYYSFTQLDGAQPFYTNNKLICFSVFLLQVPDEVRKHVQSIQNTWRGGGTSCGENADCCCI